MFLAIIVCVSWCTYEKGFSRVYPWEELLDRRIVLNSSVLSVDTPAWDFSLN